MKNNLCMLYSYNVVYCVQKSLTVSCMLLCECGDRVKVDQSSFRSVVPACSDVTSSLLGVCHGVVLV